MSLGGRRVRARSLAALVAILGLVGALAGGCKNGQPPYEVLPQNGAPEDFLPPPPQGIVPGITPELGLIYRFDRTKYRLFKPLAGTDPRFIRRDSVLALVSAGNTGAPQSLLYRPDLSDPVLAQVYDDPRLFGFLASEAAQAGFVEGRKVPDAYRYFPSQPGNFWQSDHNQLDWTVVDSVIGPSNASTAQGMPVFQMRTSCQAAPQRQAVYLPAFYSADLYVTAAPGYGIFYHAWTLISEREFKPNPDRPQREMQRNPRFLWLSSQSLGFSTDPQASPPVTIDQCLDNLPSHLNLFPVKLCDDEIQEGDIYTTWTYLEVDPEVLRARLDSEAQLERGGRCGQPVAVGHDTLTMFPTRTFRLLCKVEARTERVVDQVEIKSSTATTIGLYPLTPAPGAVVEFRVRMSIFPGAQETTVQFLELWYLKDIGQVVRGEGERSASRSSARLSRCQVDGVLYEQPNPTFFYQPTR